MHELLTTDDASQAHRLKKREKSQLKHSDKCLLQSCTQTLRTLLKSYDQKYKRNCKTVTQTDTKDQNTVK